MIKNVTDNILNNTTVIYSNSSTSTSTTTSTTALPSTVTIKEILITTTTPVSVSTVCCSDKTTHFDFNLSTESVLSTTTTPTTTDLTTQATTSVTESEHIFQRKIWAQDGYGDYVPYDDQYTTPTTILLLNFFLVTFLMTVIGIAVYPAVKKYCDSTMLGSSRRGEPRLWIEDNEDVVSVLTSDIPECSFALLNRNKSMAVLGDDSSSACSLEVLTETEVRSELT